MQLFYRLLAAVLLLVPAALRAQTYGCTDPAASNYNPAATRNDGSCTYPAVTLTPAPIGTLSDTVKETSGLICWNGYLWTHNDDADTNLYALDTASGRIVKHIAITGAGNHDWEDITQDDSYIYIGDFGNNANGNRQDLAILRIPKAALLAGQPAVTPDMIYFSYADQTSLRPTGNNNTDFDCEAFIATADSLYLFSKQWVSGKSRIYVLPKAPGRYTAQPGAEYNVDGLITGATYLPSKRLVVLCGYKRPSALYQPFLYLLYDFSGNSFYSGNKRQLLVNPLLYQTEGIATSDGRQFFISNEQRTPVDAALRKLDLSAYLDPYYRSLGMPAVNAAAPDIYLFPNPARNSFYAVIKAVKPGSLTARIYDASGKLMTEEQHRLDAGNNKIQFAVKDSWPSGTCWVSMTWDGVEHWSQITLQ